MNYIRNYTEKSVGNKTIVEGLTLKAFPRDSHGLGLRTKTNDDILCVPLTSPHLGWSRTGSLTDGKPWRPVNVGERSGAVLTSLSVYLVLTHATRSHHNQIAGMMTAFTLSHFYY